MYAGRVARENHAECVRTREEAQTRRITVVEHFERHSARKSAQHLLHLGHGGADLRHVAAYQNVGQAGGGG